VITTVQVLGQTSLGFELSLAQILATLGTCAILEFTVMFTTRHVIAWPASGLLTGNGVALLLRVNGTEHGQWWTVRGLHIFIATAALSVLSKYVIRWRNRPLFNPSNVGLFLCFLALGTGRVNPLDFWWGPMSPSMVAVYVVILTGGLFVTTRLKMLAASITFWMTFAVGSALLARGGHCFSARWHVGPVCDRTLGHILVTSPEILIFTFFMITDPKTAPVGRNARVLYGALIGIVATLFVSTQSTEFGTKVAVLGALVVVCALRPVIELVAPSERTDSGWISPHLVRRTAIVSVVCSLALLLSIPVDNPRGANETFVLSDDTRPSIGTDLALPPVAITDAARRLDNAPNDERARDMARTLLAHLQVVADALAAGDESLAAPVMTEHGFDQLHERIPNSCWQRCEFSRLTVVVMRDSRSAQALPTLAIRGEGVVAGTNIAVDRVYALSIANDRTLIDGEYDAASRILD